MNDCGTYEASNCFLLIELGSILDDCDSQSTCPCYAGDDITSGASRVGLRGGSKSRKLKWLVKVDANNGVSHLIIKNHSGGGVSGQPENHLDTPLHDN